MGALVPGLLVKRGGFPGQGARPMFAWTTGGYLDVPRGPRWPAIVLPNAHRVLLGAAFGVALMLFACSTLKIATSNPANAEDAEDAGEGSRDAASKSGMGTTPHHDASRPEGGGPQRCTVATCTLETMLDGLYGPVSIASSGQYLYFVEVGDNIPQAGGMAWLSRVPTNKSCTMRSCFDVVEPYAFSGEL
jgi:hypothetical protein